VPPLSFSGVPHESASLLAALAVIAPVAPATAAPSGFVTRQGTELKLDGKRFRFGGTNNYYLMYKSRLMVDDVFADAKSARPGESDTDNVRAEQARAGVMPQADRGTDRPS
jgi:hypothetical protein